MEIGESSWKVNGTSRKWFEVEGNTVDRYKHTWMEIIEIVAKNSEMSRNRRKWLEVVDNG